MRRVSTKEASRRFYRLLDDAEEAPVVIERYGRPRAVIMSAADFAIVERFLGRHQEQVTAALMAGAIEKIAEGRFRKAVNLRKAALLLGGITR
jgi:prevent-host-death family protein